MDSKKILQEELSRSVFNDPWYGASLKEILEGVVSEKVFLKPFSNIHSIIEIALHINSWTEEVLSRFEGNIPYTPLSGDWPEREKDTPEYWEAVKQKIYDNTNKLIAVIDDFPEDRLHEIVGGERNPTLGTGFTFHGMIIGVLQHNAYHAGQISLINKQIDPLNRQLSH